ncbi:MAG: hypothetical protein H6714_03390 [Myxococcales bacterium]|nr:hypothetical protein [Myxococcales bacterium]
MRSIWRSAVDLGKSVSLMGALALVACGGGDSNPNPDAGLDTGTDTATDTSTDAPSEVTIISVAPEESVLAGEGWEYAAQATGSGTITWTLANAPTGLSFKDGVNTGTQITLAWATQVDEDGTYADIELVADNGDTSDTQIFTVVVDPRPAVPQIDISTTPPAATTVVDTAYSYDVELIAAQSALEVTWTLDDKPDNTMFINATTGEVTWTPDTTGNFQYTVRATNTIGEFDTETIDIQVQAVPAAPQFLTTPPSVGNLIVGVSTYSYAASAVGNPAPVITVNGSLPPGFTFSGGLLSNTPGDMVAGGYSFELVASNGNGTATQTIVLNVVNPPPTVLSITPGAGRRQSDVPVTVRGIGFDCSKSPQVAIRLGTGAPEPFSTTCVDSTTLTAIVSTNATRTGGIYGIVVSQTASADALLARRFTVTTSDDVSLNTVPGGTLAGVVTWTAADSPWHVTGSLTVTGQLTIEPGAVVMFDTDSNIYVNTGFSGGTGAILADGGAPGTGDQIVFTRYQAAGGGAPSGYYRGLRFGATTNLNVTGFRNVVLEYAGGTDNGGALYIEGTEVAPTFVDSIIRETQHEGLFLAGGSGVTTAAWFDRNWITRTGEFPVYAPARDATTLGANLTFTQNGLDLANSNYIQLYSATVSRPGSLLRRYAGVDAGFGIMGENIPYRAAGLLINGTNLTVEPGVTVEFDQNTQLRVGNGATSGGLVADGTPSLPIVFRSYSGDAGNWQRVLFDANTSAGSVLSDVRIEGFYERGIYFNNQNPVVSVQGISIQSNQPGADGVLVPGGLPGPLNFTTSVIDVTRYAVDVRQDTLTSVLGSSNTYRDATNGATAASIMRVVGGGTQTGTATWTRARASDGSTLPLVLTGDINVGAGASLTIAAGSILEMPDNGEVDVNAAVLDVAGTAAEPVTFRSTNPGTVYWDYIDFSNPGSSPSNLSYVNIQNGGTEPGQTVSSSRGSVLVRNGSIAHISHSTVANSSGFGISFQDNSHAENVFASNSITGSEYAPMYMVGNYVGRIGVDGTSTLSGNTSATLGHDGIYVAGDEISTTATWPLAPVPYIVHGSLEIRAVDTVSNSALTISPGVSVQFMPGIIVRVGLDRPGALIAVGTALNPIVFTAANTTTPGYWQGLYFRGGTESSGFFFGTPSVLDFFTISYGGNAAASHGNINFEETSEVELRDVTTTYSRYYGMSRLSSGATVDFDTGTRVYSNNGQQFGGLPAYDCVRQTNGSCIAE